MTDEQKIFDEASNHMSALAEATIQFKSALDRAGSECVRLEIRCKELEQLLSLKENTNSKGLKGLSEVNNRARTVRKMLGESKEKWKRFFNES